MSGPPDPKPPHRRRRERRGRDATATRAAHFSTDECAACGRSGIPLAAHHIVYGAPGRYRRDHPENLLMLCQTAENDEGETIEGCHPRAHGADEVTRRRIGQALAARPAIVAFVREWLGEVEGTDYLRRRYFLEPSCD